MGESGEHVLLVFPLFCLSREYFHVSDVLMYGIGARSCVDQEDIAVT